MELLAEQVLEGSATNIEFSSISGAYKDLYFFGDLLTDRVTFQSDSALIRVGNSSVDTGANYGYHRGYSGTGAADNIDNAASTIFGPIVHTTVGDNEAFANVRLLISDYADTTNHKAMQGRGGFLNAAQYFRSFVIGRWRSTSAIDVVRFYPENGTNFVAGSRLAMYGVD